MYATRIKIEEKTATPIAGPIGLNPESRSQGAMK
jgi:hypothetical protein